MNAFSGFFMCGFFFSAQQQHTKFRQKKYATTSLVGWLDQSPVVRDQTISELISFFLSQNLMCTKDIHTSGSRLETHLCILSALPKGQTKKQLNHRNKLCLPFLGL
jgi:hypothetical protein